MIMKFLLEETNSPFLLSKNGEIFSMKDQFRFLYLRFLSILEGYSGRENNADFFSTIAGDHQPDVLRNNSRNDHYKIDSENKRENCRRLSTMSSDCFSPLTTMTCRVTLTKVKLIHSDILQQVTIVTSLSRVLFLNSQLWLRGRDCPGWPAFKTWTF